MKIALQFAVATAVLLLSAMAARASPHTQHFTVECATGRTITEALATGDSRKPLVITVSGTCNEFVVISRDDVTLEGDSISGGTVNAPNATGFAVTVEANRVTIDRLTVTGGLDGILVRHAAMAIVSNSTIQNTNRYGINIIDSHARILNCTVQKAGSHGVSLQNSGVQVNNSQIFDNGASGIYSRMNSGLNANGNNIHSNGGTGVYLYMDSSGFFTGNTISNNGTDSTSNFERNGILVSFSNANLTGNTIENNSGNGVKGVAARVDMFSNTVRDNGGGGVWAFGTFLGMSGDTVKTNQGYGVLFNVHSTGSIFGAFIENNFGNGISLAQGSKLILSQPTSVVGNSALGLDCFGAGTYVNDTSLLSGNVSPNCTEF